MERAVDMEQELMIAGDAGCSAATTEEERAFRRSRKTLRSPRPPLTSSTDQSEEEATDETVLGKLRARKRRKEVSEDAEEAHHPTMKSLLEEIQVLLLLCEASPEVSDIFKETAGRVMEKAQRVATTMQGTQGTANLDNKHTQTAGSDLAAIQAALKKGEVQDLKELAEKRWPQQAFELVEEVRGLPKADDERACVYVLDLEGDKKSKIACRVCDLAPGIKRKLNSGAMLPGTVVRHVAATDVIGEKEEIDPSGNLYVIPVKGEDITAVDWLLSGLETVSTYEVHPVTVAAPGGKLGSIVKNTLEFWARKHKRKVTMFHSGDPTEERRERQTETVVLRQTGKSYAELLRQVKVTVGEELAPNILSVRKGRGEDVEVRVRAGTNSAQSLREKLAQKAPEVKIGGKGQLDRKEVVHIRDLDAEVTKEEVMAAVQRALEGKTSARITSVRQAYGQTQNATVVLPLEEAKRLTSTGRLLVGWQSCRAEIRRPDVNCFRCWETGHVAAHCTGPDRRACCYNCGATGHKRAECREPTKCVGCGVIGHRLGSRDCKHVRK